MSSDTQEARKLTWAEETMQMVNRLTPDIHDKSFDPDWFLLRQRFEEVEAALSRSAEPTDAQIKHMVNRFLQWRLPGNFNPDGGISFKKSFNEHTSHPMKHEPVGTNLLDATQAEEMVRYMVEGIPPKELESRSPSTSEICNRAFRMIGFLCSVINSGESLNKQDGAEIAKMLEDLRRPSSSAPEGTTEKI